MIVRQARTVSTVSLSTIQRITAYSLPPVVPPTISRSLAEAGFHSERSLRGLSLTPQHRWNCLQWFLSQSLWSPWDWHRTVLSDESRFTLVPNDLRICV
ncbi:transposable element Tcb2 transposase [Trichonephila clavipes]|nr:transposable element Tcb2 transposase [Trichonephila clavipes]